MIVPVGILVKIIIIRALIPAIRKVVVMKVKIMVHLMLHHNLNPMQFVV